MDVWAALFCQQWLHKSWHQLQWWWRFDEACHYSHFIWSCLHANNCSDYNANWCHCWEWNGHLMCMRQNILLLFFLRCSLLVFYFSFEASIFPMIMMILLWGMQPERSSAFFFLMIYSVVSSYPFFCCMAFCMSRSILLLHHSSTALIVALTLAFFVKLPIYLLHLWLPKLMLKHQHWDRSC